MDSASSEREQRKQISVLFADVSGFTAMSETMDAEEVREVMNAVWERLDRAILSHGGRVDKHIGDAVMALFGVPAAKEDDAERAVRAALAMQGELRDFAAGRVGAAQGLKMRIGIHSGPVVLGTVGANAEFTAMGDAVNLASRLEHAAPVGGILVSNDVFRQVEGLFETEALYSIEVKGKKEPVPVCVVTRARPRDFQADARRGVSGIETSMVGREAELKELEDSLVEASEEGESAMLTVWGDAGLGKSRLRFEFERWVKGRPEAVWFLKGRATSQGTGAPYALLRDVFASRFDILDSDSAAVARDKFERGAAEFIGPGGASKAHAMGQMLGFDFSGSPGLRGLDAGLLRERGTAALGELLAGAAKSSPVLLLLEDIHWADDQSLDALLGVLRTRPKLPLLVLAFARPTLFERRPSWGEGEAAHRKLGLRPLSRRDARRMVADVLRRVDPLPDELRELVVGGAEGNPFYAEQLVKMLLDQKIVLQGDAWTVDLARLAELRVPPTLTGVLQARLDGLTASERETLRRAAVVGRIFWDRAVEACAGGAACSQDLEALRGKEMVFRREASAVFGSAEFIFKHALLRDVAYESVLLRDRRAYHARAADWLIAQGGDRLDERSSSIAEHLELASESARAAEFWEKAGARALALNAFPEARTLLERALAAGGAGWPGRPKALRALGFTLYSLSDFEASWRSLEEAVALARQGGDLGLLCAALCVQARVSYSWVRVEDTMRLGLEALSIAREAGDRTGTAEALNMLGLASMQSGSLESATALSEECLALQEEVGNSLGAARARLLLGVIASRGGRREEALDWYGRALVCFREVGSRDGAALALNNMAGCHLALGRVDEAGRLSGESIAIHRETGNRKGLASALDYAGEAARRRGDHPVAARAYREGAAIALDVGAVATALILLASMSALRAAAGDPAAAAEALGAVLASPACGLEVRQRAVEALDTVKAILSADALEAALARGRALDWKDVLRRELERP